MSQKKEAQLQMDEAEGTYGIFARFKDPVYRSRFFYWIWLAFAIFTLGMIISQAGPTFPDIQIITDTDKATASFFFTAGSFGYFLGSVIGGSIHGKVNNNMVMMVASLLAGGTTIATPYCTSVVAMLFIRCACSVCAGSIDTSVNAEHMRIWGSSGESLLQMIHFSFAFGGIFGPLFTEPFLAEKENKTTTEALSNNESMLVNFTTPSVYNLSDFGNTTSHHRPTEVRYAFLIGGIIWASSSIPFIVMLLRDRGTERDSKNEKEKYTQELPKRDLPRPLYVFVTATLCIYNVLYCCVEFVFSAYLMTFLVDEYEEVSTSQGAYITTYYWASFAAARFASIFTAKWFSAAQILYIHFFLMIISLTGFLVSAHFGLIGAITGFTCITGISLSAIFPAMFSWTEAEIIRVTGRVSGIFLAGSSLGGMGFPFLLGHLMEDLSNMWFCYILIIAAGLTISLFIFLLLFNRLYINKVYGTLGEGRAIEKVIEPPINTISSRL